MKRMSALRTPYRSRSIVSSGSTSQMEEAALDRAVVVTQLVLIALCVARAGSDVLHGPRTIEGGVAAALFVVLATWLVAKAIGKTWRAATRKRGVSTHFLQWTRGAR